MGLDPVACDFTDLKLAISQAESGDVLQLQATSFSGSSSSNFNIASKSLTLEGGYLACGGQRSSDPSVLAGGGGADSVLEIFGSGTHAVYLERLVINNGKDDVDDGGGIEIDGGFSVFLLDVSVVLNESDRGGGIHIDGRDGALLSLNGDTQIWLNDAAVQGGGIYCENGADLYLNAPGKVTENTSLGDGGGLWLSGCSVMNTFISFPGSDFLIASNEASGDGGGIYMDGGIFYRTPVSYQGTLIISDNEAGIGVGTGLGGGIFVSGFGAGIDLDRAFVIGNRADQGGGFYAQDGAEISLRVHGGCDETFCNQLSENRAPFGGAAVVLDGAFADIELTLIRGNSSPLGIAGEAPIAYVNTGGEIIFEGSVIAENSVATGVASAGVLDLGGFVKAFGTTFFSNSSVDHLFWIGGQFSGRQLILDFDEGELFDLRPSGSWLLDCAVLTPGAGLPPGGTGLFFGHSLMIDPLLGDYHLAAGSPAIDLCGPSSAGLGTDYDSDSRPLGSGADAGADEFDFPLFRDGFESGSASAWTVSTP